jgi:membrane-associated protein
LELLTEFIDIILHLDRHLIWLIQNYENWIYLILFLIIFCETGLVITPFLPGDSLLFVAGTVAASGVMDVQFLVILLMLAAFSGDNTNYWIGRYLGPKIFTRTDSRILNRKHLEKTNRFYERMVYTRFMTYSALGSFFWINSFIFGGYFFGNVPIVKNNLSFFILGIVLISIIPGIVQFMRNWLESSKESKNYNKID